MPGSTTWLSEEPLLIFLLILCILIAFGNTVVRCLSMRRRRVGTVQETASYLTAEVRVRRALPPEAAGGPASLVGRAWPRPFPVSVLEQGSPGTRLSWDKGMALKRQTALRNIRDSGEKCDYFNLTFSGN